MGVVVAATANPGKLAELAAALEPAGFEVAGFDTLSDTSEVDETGRTFEENARLKAEAYSSRTELPVIADDSGLEVDALGGAPGVLSARYGSAGLTDIARCRVLLKALTGVPEPKRTARFHCVLAVAKAGRVLATLEGAAEGKILTRPTGKGGFGYDPIFFHPGVGRSFGELTREEKEKISHRGEAIAAFLEALRQGDARLAGVG